MSENKKNDALKARDLDLMQNTPELLKEHLAVTGGKIRTRFPPEPNGYLHIGHAKSINMNFRLAFDKLGVPEDKRFVVFRYDDTNPEAESQEFIDSIAENLNWLGFKPDITTFASDYFQELYDLGVRLIKKGLAYVCHQTQEEIEKSRQIIRQKLKYAEAIKRGENPKPVLEDQCSPYRNRSVEENLRLFEDMRQGMFDEGKATMRMKMDMNSPNPNMWDSVAFRIKYVPHPHAGDGWCIYPSYDFTHCVVDALEHVDYSICTLEFETRRDSYYWLNHSLEIFRPKVYEFARLNMTYTVMSKRLIRRLVTTKIVRGWDDPRLPTLNGLRRRGYCPDIINAFCQEIGVTRTNSTIPINRLEGHARKYFGPRVRRAMAVQDPLKVTITNLPKDHVEMRKVLDYPQDTTKTDSHLIRFSKVIYIDRCDFRKIDSPDFYGLAPDKEVFLKYAYNFTCREVINRNGKVVELRGTVNKAATKRPKGIIQWVPDGSQIVEIRNYQSLFTVPTFDDPSCEGLDFDGLCKKFLRKDSEMVYKTAMLDNSISSSLEASTCIQFERLGYFAVDYDSRPEKMVFNRVITLLEKGKGKKVGKSRKQEQMAAMKAKEELKNVDPVMMFRNETDKYSQFDKDGIPTHKADGEKLSKNAFKKLKKQWTKQKKLFQNSQKK